MHLLKFHKFELCTMMSHVSVWWTEVITKQSIHGEIKWVIE